MKHHLRTVAVAVFAFAIGLAVAHLAQPARAAAAPLVAGTFDLAAVTADSLPPGPAALPNLRSKTLVVEDGMSLTVQMGTGGKHYHTNSDEIQIVLDGTGTETLGDNQIVMKPGTLILIPKGTAHFGDVETSGHLKWISIKTPPQDPSDFHLIP